MLVSIEERRYLPFFFSFLIDELLQLGNSRGPPGRGRSGARAAPPTRPCPAPAAKLFLALTLDNWKYSK